MKKSCLLHFSHKTALTVLCVVLFVLSYPLMHHMLSIPQSDLAIHAQYADSIAFSSIKTWFQTIPHPLWHFAVLLLRTLGVPFGHAGGIVTACTKVLLMLVINRFYAQLLKGSVRSVWIPFLSFITVMVAAVRIPSINPHVYVNAGSPNPWHSPTQLMMMLWMLLCVFFLSHSYDRQLQSPDVCDLTWKRTAIFSGLLLASLLSKPVFVQCFFPGAAIYFLYQWIRHPGLTRYYVRLLISLIPTILFVFLQLNSYYGAASDSGFRFVFDPSLLIDSLRTAVLINAFPIFVLLFSCRKPHGSLVPLAVLTNICAFAEKVFFGESGVRAQHGNWGWALLAASMLLWVIAIPQFAKMLKEKRTKLNLLKNAAGALLLAWHFASGLYYLYHLYTSGIWY